MQLGELGGPPAALTADDLVAAGGARLRTDQDGLQDAVLADGVRKLP
jgi:hypothetical protein